MRYGGIEGSEAEEGYSSGAHHSTAATFFGDLKQVVALLRAEGFKRVSTEQADGDRRPGRDH